MDASLIRPRPDQLAALAPLAGFSAERLAELAQVAVVERARRGSDPLQERLEGPQSVFLLAGVGNLLLLVPLLAVVTDDALAAAETEAETRATT